MTDDHQVSSSPEFPMVCCLAIPCRSVPDEKYHHPHLNRYDKHIAMQQHLKGKFTQNESFISGRDWDAESNGEGPRCTR